MNHVMPEISLTDFVEFVNKIGPPRLTKVKEIKTRPAYSPAVDFWKPLREAIRDFHKTGKPLDPVLGGIAHTKKAGLSEFRRISLSCVDRHAFDGSEF